MTLHYDRPGDLTPTENDRWHDAEKSVEKNPDVLSKKERELITETEVLLKEAASRYKNNTDELVKAQADELQSVKQWYQLQNSKIQELNDENNKLVQLLHDACDILQENDLL
nr:MAG: hypothetical protein [Microvirus sp.]